MPRAGGRRATAGAWLEPGNGCLRQLVWECHLDGSFPDVGGWVAALERRGWTVASGPTAGTLVQLAHPAGHRVVVVPATRRVQIRVDYLVAYGDRPQAALDVAAELVAAAQA